MEDKKDERAVKCKRKRGIGCEVLGGVAVDEAAGQSRKKTAGDGPAQTLTTLAGINDLRHADSSALSALDFVVCVG